jgi:hypothetical protein
VPDQPADDRSGPGADSAALDCIARPATHEDDRNGEDESVDFYKV